MKILLKIILFVVALLVILPLEITQPTYKRAAVASSKMGPALNFYVKHNNWTSPFSPHDVLQNWVKLGIHQMNSSTTLVLLGSPKVDWVFIKSNDINPLKVGPKRGEATAAVVFVFRRTLQGTTELVAYGYNDEFGIYRMYLLDLNSDSYVLRDSMQSREGYEYGHRHMYEGRGHMYEGRRGRGHMMRDYDYDNHMNDRGYYSDRYNN